MCSFLAAISSKVGAAVSFVEGPLFPSMTYYGISRVQFSEAVWVCDGPAGMSAYSPAGLCLMASVLAMSASISALFLSYLS